MNIIFGLSLAVSACQVDIDKADIDPQQERTTARAKVLCGQLIETMRSAGFFIQSRAQSILQSEYPGDYGPWVGMFMDEWKRFVILASS